MACENEKKIANAEQVYRVSEADLPLCCPSKDMKLWNSHPRVYLPIHESEQGRVSCPYCGAVYILDEKQK